VPLRPDDVQAAHLDDLGVTLFPIRFECLDLRLAANSALGAG